MWALRCGKGVTGDHLFVISATCLVLSCFDVSNCHKPLSVMCLALCSDACWLKANQSVCTHEMSLCVLCDGTGISLRGSDFGTIGDPLHPAARCINDTWKRQLVTRSGLPRLRCCVCHLHYKRAVSAPASVRQFFKTVLQQVHHFNVDVFAGQANAAAFKYYKKQGRQDLHDSSVAVMSRERCNVRSIRDTHDERRLHIDHTTNNHPT